MPEVDLKKAESGIVDISDRCARLLGQICYAGSPIDPRAIRALSALTDSVDISDKCTRSLGQLCYAGIPIDPRTIRALTFLTDKVDVSGSSVSITGTPSIDVTDRCNRQLGTLCSSGVAIDPRQIRNLTFASDKADVSGSTVTSTISGTPTVDVTDRCARLLGVLCSGGIAIDPRSIRALTNTDVVTADGSNGVALQQLALTNDLITRPYGSQGQQFQQKAATFELLNDTVDRAARLVGVTYGSQGQQLQQLAGTFELLTRPFGSQAQQLLQRAVTFDLQTQLRTNGIEYDARDRNWDLAFATDQVDVSGSTITVNAGTDLNTSTLATKASIDELHNVLTQILMEQKRTNTYLSLLADTYVNNSDII